MFKQILFPVDFTGNSVRVIPFVLDVAEKYNARVQVLHVVTAEVGGDLYIPGESLITFISEIRSGAEKMMKEYCETHFAGRENIFGLVLDGDPIEEIIKFAEEHDGCLIIMGTHGRKGLDRVVFGSVAENVLRKSPVPVLTVNPHLVAEVLPREEKRDAD